jgi:hypothetical protein
MASHASSNNIGHSPKSLDQAQERAPRPGLLMRRPHFSFRLQPGLLFRKHGRQLVGFRFHLSPFHRLSVIGQPHDHFAVTNGDDHVAFWTVAISTDRDLSPIVSIELEHPTVDRGGRGMSRRGLPRDGCVITLQLDRSGLTSSDHLPSLVLVAQRFAG